MPGIAKFKPRIYRVKLNSEQTVLACKCYNTMWYLSHHGGYSTSKPEKMKTACAGAGKGFILGCSRGSTSGNLPGADTGATLS